MRALIIGATALLCSVGMAFAQGTLTAAPGTFTSMTTSVPPGVAVPDIPKGNHYVCYPVKVEQFKPRVATFRDQFGVWSMTVIKPTHLCTPAEKRADNRVYPMTDPRLHMVCYDVKYNGRTLPPVITNDQFGPMKLVLGQASTVCLPAGKTPLK
jgi:hypothetical protein